MRALPAAAAAPPAVKRAALLALVVALAGCGRSGGDDDDDRRRPAPRPSGDPERHLAALQRIADRSDGTRAAGTPGERRTAEYVAATLRAAGWRVRTEPVRFPYFELRSVRVGDLEPGRDLRVAQYSGAGRVRARVRRVGGNGCSAGDYAAVRQGEIALADRGTCFFAAKAEVAERAGAAALIVSDVYGRTPVSATLIRPGTEIPVVVVAGAKARSLDGQTLRLSVDAVSERRVAQNVLAETPGERVVMAGAHLDSVTAGPGINDNGTGIAALLAFAERARDVRGLRLAFWTAEELALYGSRHYVRGLSDAGRRALVGYVNFDMVGSPNGRMLVYDRDNAIERELRRALPGKEDEVRLTGASDHAPFERAGIPVGGLFTGASERGKGPGPADRCYHRSCDTLRNVDAELLRRMTDAAERALVRLAPRQP